MNETKAEKQETKTRQPVKNEAVQKKTVVYIGPTIKSVVSTGTIYNNGLPESLKKEIEKLPLIGSLLIPVDGLAAAQKELATPGSALAVIYEKVVNDRREN